MFRLLLACGMLAVCLAQTLSPPEPLSTEFMSPPPTHISPKPKSASYWVTYGKNVRPGHPMVFQVRIFKGTSPVDVSIVLRNDQGNAVLEHGPVSISPGLPQMISIMIPSNIKKPSDEYYYYQNYKVEVIGSGPELRFKNKGYATYQEKAFSIFVQTDKAMYKPSQTVKFRTLAMNPDMKVRMDVKQDIIVMDSKGNRILQFRGLEAPDTMGVIQKEFKLASSVPLGKWKIQVTIDGVKEEKEFEVSDYVLPRFEVEIDAPPYGISDDLIYEFTVRAKYTFGKPVTKGKVAVEVDLEYWSRTPIKPIMLAGKLDSNGEFKVQVTINELLMLAQKYMTFYKLKNIDGRRFKIMANVTEANTMKMQSGSHEVQFYASYIKMTFLGITPSTYKAGLDFTAYLELTKHDGALFTPLESKQIKVIINVTYMVPVTRSTPPPPKEETATSSGEPGTTFPVREIMDSHMGRFWYPRTTSKTLTLDKDVYTLPENGWVLVTFRVPDEATSFTIEAKTLSPYQEQTSSFYASKSHSPSESFLQLNVINKKIKVGDTLDVQAKSTDPMTFLNYQVFSKGLLVASDVKSMTSAARSATFNVEVTSAMSPSMSIVAFYVRSDGEFVVDALSLSVDGLFNNAVSIEFDKQKVQPGEDVKAIVRGEEGSVVFLLAVDKSVKLLKSGNDITQDLVREELASYDYGNYGSWRYMFICGWPSYFGGEDASSVFQSAGVIVMTDGLVYNRYNDDQNSNGPQILFTMRNGAMMEDAVPMSSAQEGMKPAKRVRKLFPENWLWEAKVINSGGKVVIPLTAPDTITSWVATVFSASHSSGLSVAASPAEVITFRNLFVSLDLPTSIVRYEEFCFPASVFSYYPEELYLFLTLDYSPDFSNLWAKTKDGKVSLQKEKLFYTYFLPLRENEVHTVTFCFTPETIGTIPIQVSVLSNVDGLSDRVERKLRVKPEGFPRVTTMPHLVKPENGKWDQLVDVQFPTDTVDGSERISVNIAGNLLGNIFNNLDDLIKKPYGCGEQNMINFAPLMSLLDFFFTTNTTTEEIRDKIVSYMFLGYEKEILYEHGTSGGYSTFGNSDSTKNNASVWLTAFVTKCFSQAELLDMKYKNILAIDTDLISRSFKWMLTQQDTDGSFVENGRVFNKGLQGGSSSKGVALTAYTLISMYYASDVLASLEGGVPDKMLSGMIKARSYLEGRISSLTDPYDACITAYALNLWSSSKKDEAFEKMESMKKSGFGYTYWKRENKPKTNYYWWSRDTDAINIEMTAYALLTYHLREPQSPESLPIVRWLSQQKGEHGGFISTQDTVIGIEALTSVAKELYGAQFVPMTITVSTFDAANQSQSTDFDITRDNQMILQRKDIPYKAGSKILLTSKSSNNVDTSRSTVLVDVVFNYNVESETLPEVYDMSNTVSTYDGGYDLHITVWTVDGKSAGMTMIEVEIAAGYYADLQAIVEKNPIISNVDVKNDHLNVYVDTDMIDGDGIKLHLIMAEGEGKLLDSKPKSYKVYNYYEDELELTKKYYLKKEDFCVKMPQMDACQVQ